MARQVLIVAPPLVFGLGTAVAILLLPLLAAHFFVVSLGPASLPEFLRYPPRVPLSPIPELFGGALGAAASALVFARRSAASFAITVAPIPALLLLAVVTFSYRLPALLLCPVAFALYFRYIATGNGLRLAAIAAALVLSLCALPADITLQNPPGPGRFIPVAGGLPTSGSFEAHQRGEHLIVSGCVSTFREPTFAWVW